MVRYAFVILVIFICPISYADTITLSAGTYGGILDYTGHDVVISATITIKSWDNTPDSGYLEIRANNIVVTSTGTILGFGRGYGGGGGGAGAHGNFLAGNGGITGTTLPNGTIGGDADVNKGGNGGKGGGYGGGGGGGGGAWSASGGQPGSGSDGGGNGINGSDGNTSYTGWPYSGGGGGGGTANGSTAGSGTIPEGGAGSAGGGHGGSGGADGRFGFDGGGGGGGGAGPFGGTGGNGGIATYLDGTPGARGGYLSIGANGDDSTDFSVYIGSGGGGGGGGNQQGGRGGAGGRRGGAGGEGGGGGGGGGSGGAEIVLEVADSISIEGQIIADGAGLAERNGGYGAGGGIAIMAQIVDLAPDTLSSLGGNGNGNGVTINGGTIKIFANTILGEPGNKAGRIYIANMEGCVSPSIVVHPQSRSIVISQNVQFTVQPQGSPPFTYKWYKDDQPISNSNNSVLAISSAQLSDAGSYKVDVNNDCDSATSNTAVLTVETKYRVSGHVLDSDNQPIENVKVQVIKRSPITGREYAVRTTYTYEDGYYDTNLIDADWSYNAGYDCVLVSLDNNIVTIRDYSNDRQTINRTAAPCQDSSSCHIDFKFGASETRQQQEQEGVRVFREIQAAHIFINDTYFYDEKAQAIANVFYDTNSYTCPLTGQIYIQESSNIAKSIVWHEYAHFIHRQKLYGLPIYFVGPGLREGWAFYVEKFIYPTFDLESNSHFDSSLGRDWAHAWGIVYAEILFDINDPCSKDDEDEIDGLAPHYDSVNHDWVNGNQMIWRTIMEDKVAIMEPSYLTPASFYNKFTARYSSLSAPLWNIYASHGISGFVWTTTTTIAQILQTQIQTTATKIDSTISKSKFFLSWPGSDLDLTLIDPNGTIIDPCYAESHPDVNYVKTATEAYYIISNPLPGNWQMKVTAVDVPPEGENYTATAYLTTNLNLLFTTDKESYEPNETISLTAQLLYDSNSYSDANVTARIERPDGNETITLYDDGLYNDGNSNDGNYANIYSNTSIEGQYNIVVTASGWNPFNEPFVREIRRTVQVMRLPDLVTADLQTSDELSQGEITLTATIQNIGTAEANDINVVFYDVNDANVIRIDPNIIIAHLEPNETNTVSVVWNATYGRHQIFVVVDSNNEIPEKDETNNYTSSVFLIDDFDFNFDGITDFTDFALLADTWLDLCDAPAWCDNFDTDRSGQVDILELAKLANHWLEGVN